jgi:hypothetical protein
MDSKIKANMDKLSDQKISQKINLEEKNKSIAKSIGRREVVARAENIFRGIGPQKEAMNALVGFYKQFYEPRKLFHEIYKLLATDNIEFYKTLLRMDEYATAHQMELPELLDFGNTPKQHFATVIQTLSPSKGKAKANTTTNTNENNLNTQETNTSTNVPSNVAPTAVPNFENMTNKELQNYIRTLIETNSTITIAKLQNKYKKYPTQMNKMELIQVIDDIKKKRL